VGVEVVPDEDERPAELLVRVVQEPGVVGLGEPLALVAGPAAAGVDAVDEPGPLPGLSLSIFLCKSRQLSSFCYITVGSF
jgi:hypothetical protein